jgi:hypothetical protein
MLACRKWGSSAGRLLLPEHPTPVLLMLANHLRFGARSKPTPKCLTGMFRRARERVHEGRPRKNTGADGGWRNLAC